MSLLFNGSYANPAQSLWVPVSGSGGGGVGSDYPVYDSSGALLGGMVAGDICGNYVTPVGLQANRFVFCLPGIKPSVGTNTFGSYIDISDSTPGDSSDYMFIDGLIGANHLMSLTGRIAGSTDIPGGQPNVSVGPIPGLTSNSFVMLSHLRRTATDRSVGNLCYNSYDVSSNTMAVYITDTSGIPITSPDNVRFNWMIINAFTDVPRPYGAN